MVKLHHLRPNTTDVIFFQRFMDPSYSVLFLLSSRACR